MSEIDGVCDACGLPRNSAGRCAFCSPIGGGPPRTSALDICGTLAPNAGYAPCTRAMGHTGLCAHPLRTMPFSALTLEELDRRVEQRFALLAKSITDALRGLADVGLETQRLAGEQALALEREARAERDKRDAAERAAPLAQMRERLIAGCYQIRLRAFLESSAERASLNDSPSGGPRDPDQHTLFAELAGRDADAVLAELHGPPL